MKKFYFALAVVLFLASPLLVDSAGELVKINSIDSEIIISKEGVIEITETISADFSASPGHGIYRDIPYAYKNRDGTKLFTEIEVIGVKDETRLSHPYSIIKNNANIRIKIGDPDVLVYGSKTYYISYSIKGILASFDEYDEFYWNAVGSGWTSAIDDSSAIVILPEEGMIQAACYKGGYGSQEPCDTKSTTANNAFFTATNIAPGESFTVAVGFRKGMVPIIAVPPPPSAVEYYLTVKNFIIFSITVLVGILGILFLWQKIGRDIWWQRKSLFDPEAKETPMPFGAHETIVPEYEPPDGLRPAEVGVLKDERVQTLDVSATIVDLAVRGYLQIVEIPKKWVFGSVDYELVKIKAADEQLLEYERELLSSLFSRSKSPEADRILLSELKNKFYKDLFKIKKLIYKEAVAKKMFTANPDSVRKKHAIFGFLGIVLSFFILITFFLPFGLGFLVVSIIYLFVSMKMPQRTAHGRETFRKVKGYELFLGNTEKYRQPFFEKENIFMEVLPYAMVFGVTKKLSSAMEKMGIQPQQPVWFVGHGGSFNVEAFGSSMDSFSKSLSSTIASSPSGSGSGGGGFSGGGGGGGGGGGW